MTLTVEQYRRLKRHGYAGRVDARRIWWLALTEQGTVRQVGTLAL